MVQVDRIFLFMASLLRRDLCYLAGHASDRVMAISRFPADFQARAQYATFWPAEGSQSSARAWRASKIKALIGVR